MPCSAGSVAVVAFDAEVAVVVVAVYDSHTLESSCQTSSEAVPPVLATRLVASLSCGLMLHV